MPYIKKIDRKPLDHEIITLINIIRGEFEVNKRSGALNYVISNLLSAMLSNKPNYDEMNSVVGVLESVKAEFQRRIVAPYEDKKIKENGDIFLYDSTKESMSVTIDNPF